MQIRHAMDGSVAIVLVVTLPLLGVCAGLALLATMACDAIRLAREHRQKEAKRRYLAKLRAQSYERHRIKKRLPDKPCPGVEAVCAQWDRSHDSLQEMINFGLLLHDVEPYVDNSPIFKKDVHGRLVLAPGRDGVMRPVIVGREPGLKGWLAEHCPHIGYKTAMRYKSLAGKSLKSLKGKTLIAKCATLHALQESLYKDLDIVHFRLEKPRIKRERPVRHNLWYPGQGRNPYQSLIFAVRTQTRDALRAFHASRVPIPPPSREAQRLAASFLALANEVRGSS